MNQVNIQKGLVFAYRIFDISEEIDLKKAEALLAQKADESKFNVPRHIDRGLIIKTASVTFPLQSQALQFRGRDLIAESFVKLRDYGVMVLTYQFRIPQGWTWMELVSFSAFLESGEQIDKWARQNKGEFVKTIAPALKKPSSWSGFEDYTIYFLEKLEGIQSARELVRRADLTALVYGESEVQISDVTKTAVLENITHYSDNDLALVEWNAAVVVEPSGSRDVCDIIEFAVSHLLEMRYYDERLGDMIGKLYNEIESLRSQKFLFSNRFESLYRESSRQHIDFSELIEKIENSFKVIGDFYLATVYRRATRKFRLGDWQNSITRKMNLLSQASSFLQGEVNIVRSHLMELVIILLITVEVVRYLF